MTALDATGLRAIQDFAESVTASGRELILCGAPPQPAEMMSNSPLIDVVGASNMQPNIDAALRRADELRGRQHVRADQPHSLQG